MNSEARPIPDHRPLTTDEFRLAKWMLERGGPAAVEFLAQLPGARVVSRCPCGCASIDFEIDGLPAPSGGLRILGDYLYGDGEDLSGIFIFERAGILAGIEVWSPLGDDAPKALPVVQVLRPA